MNQSNIRMIKDSMVVSHCRLKSLQYSCLERIEFILNRLASISDVNASQNAIFLYFFISNQESMKSRCMPSKYSNQLVNYLLSSKTASQDVLTSIVMLQDSFTLDSVSVPRNSAINRRVLLPLLVRFQLVSLDLSYCQFVDDQFFSQLAQLGNYPSLSLKKLVLKGTRITKTDMLSSFSQLKCLDMSELSLLTISQGCSSFYDRLRCLFQKQNYLTELNLYATTFPNRGSSMSLIIKSTLGNSQCFPPEFDNIVQLDLSRSVEFMNTDTWSRMDVQVNLFFFFLSCLPSLQYLDFSFWPVTYKHLKHLKRRERFLEFLGILGTNVLSTIPPNIQPNHLNVFARELTSLSDEAATINSIQHYGYRRDYVNYIVNHLIEEVDKETHQFQQPDSMANAMLDLIESWYLFNKSAFPLSIHMPPFVDFTYVISRILDKVLEHLPSSTLKRIVFDFVELARISITSISCNNQLLLNIFTVLANFNSADFSCYLVGYISDLFHLVCTMFTSFNKNSSYMNGNEHNLVEISTLILSNLTWVDSLYSEDDSLNLVQMFLLQLIEMVSHFVSQTPTDPILSYLATILMNISCERPWICKWLLSVILDLNRILSQAQYNDCETVVENMCGCFEHIMSAYLKADDEIDGWENIHQLVENAYQILACKGINVDIISSTSATIIYYWYAIENSNILPLVTEREATLEMVSDKISQVNEHVKKNFDYVNIEAPLACMESSDTNIHYFALWVVHGCLRMNLDKFCCSLEKKHLDRIYTLQFSDNYLVKEKAELISSLVSSSNKCFDL